MKYSAIKKKEILPFAPTWMDLEDTMISKISQTDKYRIISLSCASKNKQKPKQTNQKTELIDTENRLVAGK